MARKKKNGPEVEAYEPYVKFQSQAQRAIDKIANEDDGIAREHKIYDLQRLIKYAILRLQEQEALEEGTK